MGLAALTQMYRPQDGLFAFRLRRTGGKLVLEGVSRRYSAIALIGLAGQDADACRSVLAGQDVHDVCSRLVDDAQNSRDLGEVALTVWAARALKHSRAGEALKRLRKMSPDTEPFPTIEMSWALSALTVAGDDANDPSLAKSLADRLMNSQVPTSGLFPHWPEGMHGSWAQPHVACFADLVYPIHALANYHRATGDPVALAAAWACADRMCSLQGPQGQWWWHFDVRTGRVLAPMALSGLRTAGGPGRSAAGRRGLDWLDCAPEIGGSLIDTTAGIIWRKVARHERARLSRRLQATATRQNPTRRASAAARQARPGETDCEDRPYHMGWILYAWPASHSADMPQA